ncbi:MAG: hydroxymethylbilane synthase [Proteobacteria bacterium]|nr:hydroxymethylbilane synthase [Pseudomonadota bacterium]MYJ96826.1 hydroxymethylbilane synthase [Pseudomonadota bacterium]
MNFRLGTRGSHLARTQAAGVADWLAERGHDAELRIISTAGDRSKATSFGSIGPQGVFVREIEHALLAGEVDIAIHSYKDLPTQSPDDLTVGAVPERLDPADVLVMTRATAADSADALPIAGGARVGTASARRQAWIRHLRPDIRIVPIRGNVPTRINRLRTGLDGVVLAAAGIQRLRRSPLDGVADPVTDEFVVHRLAPQDFVPAPAQGALAIQCRRADEGLCKLLKSLDHAATRQAVAAERNLLARVEGGCDLAFGAWCAADGTWAKQTEEFESSDGAVHASNNAVRRSAPGTARLITWLEHDGVLHKADSQDLNPDALADSAWAELERQWTG